MGNIETPDVIVSPLARINTAGGDVLHALRRRDAGFAGFGEAYFSVVNPGAVKAWKQHQRMTLNLIVPIGNVRFVFHRSDQSQTFRVEDAGEARYVRLTVPPGIWFGFRGLGSLPSLVLNLADIEHDSAEVLRRDVGAFDFSWS